MSDRRTTPDPALVTTQIPARIGVAVCELFDAPSGKRDRQLIAGDAVTVLSTQAGHHYIRSEKDGYVGWVRAHDVTENHDVTHKVAVLATFAFSNPDFKSPEQATLSFGSQVKALSETAGYVETAFGFVPKQHLAPTNIFATDPVQIAGLFLGTPYLWGGNSRLGLDCSGLVQAALLACGIPCPGDSDQQMTLGSEATGGVKPGDLLFWKGHVALASDAQTLIHANAHAMSTVYEPLEAAITRIAKTDGPVTAHRRL